MRSLLSEVRSLSGRKVSIYPRIIEEPHFECLNSKCELLLNCRIGYWYIVTDEWETRQAAQRLGLGAAPGETNSHYYGTLLVNQGYTISGGATVASRRCWVALEKIEEA